MKSIRFQTKLIITYTFFIIILIICLGTGFYIYNIELIKQKEQDNLEQLVDKTLDQLDNAIKEMDDIAIQVIFENDIKQGLIDLNYTDNLQTIQTIQKQITNTLQKIASLKLTANQKVYRITVFNKIGYIFSTKSHNILADKMENNVLNQPWIEEVRGKQGKKYIHTPHNDYWIKDNEKRVFSLIRLIRDPKNEIGIVEIQQDYYVLEDICNIKNDNQLITLILDENNELIYKNKDISAKQINNYIQLIEQNKVYNEEQLISYKTSDYTNCTVIMLQDIKQLIEPIKASRNITMLIGIVIIIISILFIYIFSIKLTKPINRLTKKMNKMDLNNLTQPISAESDYYEIQMLTNAFQQMRERLDEAIKQVYYFKTLQLKTHFDMLQTQINPHFLYNTIGVIANMGYEAEQYDISDACRRLIQMLRYTSSINEEFSTINEEILNTQNYLGLMKIRYEHRLEYTIEIDEKLNKITIPKMIMQPLVENVFQHAFQNDMRKKMKVKIIGKTKGTTWEINILDNGTGFAKDILNHLSQKIDNYKEQIVNGKDIERLSIGGMGILNIFARLHLFFNGEMIFKINNLNEGAMITLGGYLANEIKEEII